ncbi:hypothetical protein PAMP_004309 [Pampus punctatissimus]
MKVLPNKSGGRVVAQRHTLPAGRREPTLSDRPSFVSLALEPKRSERGNWMGEAPYRVGIPCSACPFSYGGTCRNNMCFPAIHSNYMYWFK